MADSMLRSGVCGGCYATLRARRDLLKLTSDPLTQYRILRVWCPDVRCWNHEEWVLSWERFESLPEAERAALLRAADREEEQMAQLQKQAKAG